MTIRTAYPWGAPSSTLTVQSPWGTIIKAQAEAKKPQREGGRFVKKDVPQGLPVVVSNAIRAWREYNTARVKLARTRKRGFESLNEKVRLEGGLKTARDKWQRMQRMANGIGWTVSAQGKITNRPDESSVSGWYGGYVRTNGDRP